MKNQTKYNKFIYILLVFFVSCVIGWICEEIYCFMHTHIFVNRGFYYGPYLPIYGFGAICLLPLKRLKEHPIYLLLIALLITGIIEYYTGYYLLMIYHRRWWDYSKLIFNINGHVCLKSISLFGIMSLFFIYVLEPIINKFLKKNFKISEIICYTFIIVFIIDFIISTFFKY